jgi:hypothetical protein
MQFAFGMNQSPVYWDRGRLARNEREARKTHSIERQKRLRACGALRAGRPLSQKRVAARSQHT